MSSKQNDQDDLQAHKPVEDIEAHMPNGTTQKDLQAHTPPCANNREVKAEGVLGEDLSVQSPTNEPEDLKAHMQRSPTVRFGNRQEGSFMEKDSWVKYLKKRRIELEKEEDMRKERIEKAGREDKSWELARRKPIVTAGSEIKS